MSTTDEPAVREALSGAIAASARSGLLDAVLILVPTVVALLEAGRSRALLEAADWFDAEHDGQEMHGSRVAEMLRDRAEGREYVW